MVWQSFREQLARSADQHEFVQCAARSIASQLRADRAYVVLFVEGSTAQGLFQSGQGDQQRDQPLFSATSECVEFGGRSFVAPVVLSDTGRGRLDQELERAARDRGIRSLGMVPLQHRGKVCGFLEVHFCHLYFRWRKSDLAFLEHAADLIVASWDWSVQTSSSVPLQSSTGSLTAEHRQHLEAILELSRSLRIQLDPAIVSLRGLKALIQATNADCGLVSFAQDTSDQLEVVAAEGLSEDYLQNIGPRLNNSSIHSYVIATKKGVLIPDLLTDTRAAVDLAKKEGLRAAVVMPLVFEGATLGVVALFRRRTESFSAAAYSLVEAAGGQIALVLKQAQSFLAEQRNARSFAALYKLSHELSKHFSSRDVAEQAFAVIQAEFPCRRLWLGTLNEAGTHIVGQAGSGPGMRRRIVQVQIERALRHDFLDEAIKSKQPVIIEPGQQMECSGLNKILRQLRPETVVIFPLFALGQLVGVLVLEPQTRSILQVQQKLPLLQSMASEIATVILARRFESRMADADKMRMAGLIASGVAHNFNNLLQAVMGQASLIEMQLPKDSALVKSARMIIDSATRGASLIAQLLACTVQESGVRARVAMDTMLSDSTEFYKSIVGSAVSFNLTKSAQLGEVLADYNRLQQVISNLLVNAKEAVAAVAEPQILVVADKLRVRSGEVDPELAPGVYIRIQVSDNGAGMDAEMQARCFEPFFSSKVVDRSTQDLTGTSLGLSAAYSLLKQYGGLLTVESTLGKGTTFAVYLPVAPAVDRIEEDTRAKAGQNPEVLLLDLDDAVNTSMRSILDTLGVRALSLRKRGKALDILRVQGQKVRLLMVDLDRLDEDAISFLKQARTLQVDLILVACSFDTRRWSRVLADLSKLELIQKPLSVWALDALLKGILGTVKVKPLAQQIERDVVPSAGHSVQKNEGAALETPEAKE